MAEDDGLPPPNELPPPAAVPMLRGSRIVCEFCGCELDPRGNVLKRGESARAYLDLEDANKALGVQLDTARTELTQLRGQLEALQSPAKRPGFLGDL